MLVNTKIMKSTTIEDKHYSRISIINSVMQETLGDFVKRIRNEKRLSIDEVWKRSGKNISTSYINKIENEPNVNPSFSKLQALATGLGITEAEILQVVGMEMSIDDAERVELEAMYRKRKRLSPARREAFRRILDMADRELDRLYEEEQRESQEKSHTNGK